jgi:hypothetical protein
VAYSVVFQISEFESEMETKWQEKSKKMVHQCEKKWQRKYDDVVEESETMKKKLTENEGKVSMFLFCARGFHHQHLFSLRRGVKIIEYKVLPLHC